MKKVFIELTMQDNFSDFLKASFLSEYKASEDGCKEYNKQNINNSKMLCIATYDDEKWVKIGYTVVNRNGDGGTHPWTKSASIEFRNFAQSEKSCKEKILTFLNQNYPNPSSAPIGNVVAQDKDLSNKKESNVQAKVEQATIIKELTVTSNVNSSTRQNSQENSETQENIKETICISDIKWNNEWNCKKSNNNHKINVTVTAQVSKRNKNLIKSAILGFFAEEQDYKREVLKNFICKEIFEPIFTNNSDVLMDIIKKSELCFANAIAEKLNVSKPENGNINDAVKKWQKENPALFYSMFNSIDDLEKIDQCNRECNDPAYITQKFSLFELVIGNVEKAKLIVLNNNPGADSVVHPSIFLRESVDKFVDFLDIFIESQKYQGAKNLKNIFYPFCRSFINLISDYFPIRFLSKNKGKSSKLFDSLLQGNFCKRKESVLTEDKIYPERYYNIWEKVSPYVVSLERFGYHSKYFRNYEAKLQDKFVDQRRIVENILKNAASKPLNERPIILVFRGGDAWENLLGENFFKEYEKVYFVSNVQNPTVSNSQLGQDEFKQIKLDWNALVDDETLHLK